MEFWSLYLGCYQPNSVFSISNVLLQGRNEVYGSGIKAGQKMGWDQGSQARDLGSQAVGSGSVVLRGDQGSSFPTENQIS